jgi:hypothetical protein
MAIFGRDNGGWGSPNGMVALKPRILAGTAVFGHDNHNHDTLEVRASPPDPRT